MNTSRRTFIKNSGLAVAGTSLLPGILKKTADNVIAGIQLYSVREDMEKDTAGTLKKLAAMGYKYVEAAGYADRKFYGYSIPDFKKLLKDNGLIMKSGHSFLGSEQWDKTKSDFTDDWKYTIEDAAAVGMKYLISPGVDEGLCKNMDGFNHFINLFNKTGELCQKSEIHFAFHNENYEFNHSLGGTLIYDLILQKTNKNLVLQQMDIGNMYEPGGRAMHFLQKYPGRFFSMHVKDEMKRNSPGPDGNAYDSTILGKGVIPIKEIIDYARKSGINYFIIEQEQYQDKTPLACADADLKMMEEWGFK